MNDALLVRRVERLGYLTREFHGVVDGQRAAGEAFRQVFAVNQLEDEYFLRVGVLEAVDRRDVGVVERREHPGLAVEAGESLVVVDERLG